MKAPGGYMGAAVYGAIAGLLGFWLVKSFL